MAFTALFPGQNAGLDPALNSLFSSSAGPVRQEERHRDGPKSHPSTVVQFESHADSISESSKESSGDSDASQDSTSSNQQSEQQKLPEESKKRTRKRKRSDEDDSIERRALQRLANYDEDTTEIDNSKPNGLDHEAPNSSDVESEVDQDADEEPSFKEVIPQHESLAKGDENPDMDKASRTAFLGNVSSQAILSKSAKKVLLKHLASFLSELPPSDTPHKVESIRFRSTAFDSKLPKKAAYVKKELMDATSHSTNAYAVYTTKVACREAARRLNGTIVLDRHLRVDQVAHPAKTDHKKCVFVGNLDFVDDDTKIRDDAEDHKKKKSKGRQPADVEEGLWREFSKSGTVESVRVIRDSKTRIGKGFAYVQFVNENSVESALLLNDKKFPPLLPRKLRVMRAKSIKRNSSTLSNGNKRPGTDRTMSGRAGNLLGRAGAAHVRQNGSNGPKPRKVEQAKPAPEKVVFEGIRAKSNDGTAGLKFGGKRKGKPKGRRTQRSSDWRKK